MRDIKVQPVEFPTDAGRFIRAWWNIFEGDPCWVPPLISEQKRFLNPRRNPYFKTATVQPFMATRAGRDVGTLACTVDHHLQKREPGVGLFGFFEFVNDPDVASALFETGTTWFRGHGIHTIRGPFSFNSNHEFGLLVSQFDDPPCVGNPHNGWWYPAIYQDRLELEKARDWYAYWMGYGPVPDRVRAIAERLLDRHPSLSLRPLNKRTFWQDCELFWELYNDAWSDQWGHVFMERDEFMDKARSLKPVLDERLAFFAYLGDEPAAASITLPDYNQVARHMNGRLFPFGWRHVVNASRYVNRLRVLVLGVKKQYQHMPLGAPLYVETWREAKRRGTIRGVEASLVVEDNHRMRGALEKLGASIRKTYRTYEKRIARAV